MTAAVDDPETSIVVEADLDAPPEQVWKALTDPALRDAWLRPDPGVVIDVIEAEPFHRLRLGWRGAEGEHDASGRPLDTEVTFTLEPAAGGAHLTIVHSGFAARAYTDAQAEIVTLPATRPGGRAATMMGGLRWAA